MTLVKNDERADLKRAAFDELTKLFQKCHDTIWQGGKEDPATAFDEFSKLLMAKIYDERFTPTSAEYQFQIKDGEGPAAVARKVRKMYLKVKEKNPDVFKVNIKLPAPQIYDIVRTLQGVSLRSTDLDIKGRAFEKFLGKIFRGEHGQYFTPRSVVKFMVEVLDPDEHDLVMDPACGSGGFLLYSLKHVTDKISTRYKDDQDSLNRIVWDFSHKQIFGVEINDRIARIAMMDMVIHEDGHSNIERNNALFCYENFDNRRDIRPNKYSLILTNPPFGAVVKDKHILTNFDLCKGKTSQKTEILFIERCFELLKNGGKLAIVLPDSILTNSSLQHVRDYVLSRATLLAVVSLPHHAFVPSGAGVKSSLIFLQKSKPKRRKQRVFMAVAKHIGFDARGEKDTDQLHDILADWKAYNSGKTTLRRAFLVNPDSLRENFSPEKFVFYSTDRKWNFIKLSELCDGRIFAGRTPARKLYKTSGNKILKCRDLTGKGIDWDNSERGFVSNEFFAKFPNILLQKNDILIITAAHHPKYIGKKVDIIDYIPKLYEGGVICSAELMASGPKIYSCS